MTLSEYALKFVGRPYIWGGDGSGKCGGGFDCSGLVLECLWALGLYDGKDVTAQGLHDTLCKKGWKNVPKDFVFDGDILFFGKAVDKITHTAIAIDNNLMVEAYGTSKCTTPSNSTGKVHVRPIRANIVAALRAY